MVCSYNGYSDFENPQYNVWDDGPDFTTFICPHVKDCFDYYWLIRLYNPE